jgi:general secretion pathway protein G
MILFIKKYFLRQSVFYKTFLQQRVLKKSKKKCILFFYILRMKAQAKGFTLIELLVVISIIGILAVSGITFFASSQEKARDSTRQKDLASMNSATLQYATGNSGVYPTQSDVAGEGLNILVDKQFITMLPKEPKSGQVYNYINGQELGTVIEGYEFSANLEAVDNIKSEMGTGAAGDSGNNDARYEIGVKVALLGTTDAYTYDDDATQIATGDTVSEGTTIDYLGALTEL